MSETLPPVIARLLLDGKQFSAGLATAKGEMEAMTGKSGAAFQGLASIGKAALIGLSAAAIGVGIISVKLASTFQASMERIATQAQVPQSQIKGLSNAVLNMTGQVGISANTLAQGLYHVESAFQSTGITGARAMEILKIASEGARIGGADLVDVTNALDAAIVSGIPGVQNFSQAMGALNAVVGAGDMTMQDLADAMGTGVLAVVKNYGLSLTDAGAALATFGDNNIRGATAATALRMAVQALAVPAKAGTAFLDKMGMSTTQLAVDMQRGGLVPALQDLKTHIEAAGYTSVQTGQILTQIFGKRAGVGVAVLYDQLDRLKSKYGDISNASKNFGDAWAETQKTFKQQWAELAKTVEAIAIRIGLWLIPKLQELAAVVMQVVQWFERHKTVALALGVAIGTVLVVAIGYYIAGMVAAAAATLAATWPVLAIIAAIAALAAGVVYAYTHWQWFRDTVDTVWQWIQRTLWPGLQSFAAWLGSLFDDPLRAISVAFNDTFGRIGSLVHGVASLLGGGPFHVNVPQITGSLVQHPGTPTGFPTAGSSGQHPGTPTSPVYGPPAPPAGWRGGLIGPPAPPPGWNAAPKPGTVAQAWHDVYSAMAPIVNQIGDLVNKEGGQIAGWWRGHMGEVSKVGRDAWQGVRGYTKVAMGEIQVVIDVGTKIIKSMWDPFWNGMTNVAKGTWTTIRNVIDIALKLILGYIGVELDLLSGKWGRSWKDLTKTVGGVFGDLLKIVTQAIPNFFSAGLDLAHALVNGINSGLGGLAGAVGNALAGAASHIPVVGGFLNHVLHNAAGGPLGAGQVSVVGENGPELFVSGVSGMVMPNDVVRQLSGRSSSGSSVGGGGNIYVTLHVQGNLWATNDLADVLRDRLLQLQRSMPGGLGFR